MFNSNEFEQWYNDLSLSQDAIEVITRIRENDPSRRVGGGRKNVVGAYPSKKMGLSIQFESHKLELAGAYLKEHDDTVIEYYDQPLTIKIKYKFRGEGRQVQGNSCRALAEIISGVVKGTLQFQLLQGF